jgi:outer membrane protein OmpA-like peptidoglycan-associated protein
MRAHPLALAIVLSSAPCLGADSLPGAPAIRVPFVVGLSTVRAVSTPEGDYEVLRVVDAIDNTAYRVTVSGEAPADDGGDPVEVEVSRTVRTEDQSKARKMRNYFHDGDPEAFPGTVPGVSAAVIEDLRKSGTAELTVLDVGQMFGVSTVRRTLSGTIARVAGGPASVPMLVNGHLLPLPVIQAKGRLSQNNQAEEYELYLLDDPANPIVLRLKGAGTSSAIIKIEYPEPRNVPTSLERSLAAREVAAVYGVYFSFARADLRKQSEPVLAQIAAVLKANPQWKLRIDGHTDGIGNDAANLDLSKRRAAAVKAALVSRYAVDASRLTTGGYGEGSPRATNETPEGRALNRRVELRRE